MFLNNLLFETNRFVHYTHINKLDILNFDGYPERNCTSVSLCAEGISV